MHAGLSVPAMKTVVVVVWIILHLCPRHQSLPACTVSTDAHVQGSVVDCSHRNLDAVPVDLPNNTVHLDLSFNNINVLKNGSFQHLTRLVWLSIASSNLHRLEASALTGLSRLRTLHLQSNAILLDNSSYPEVIFYELENLQELDIGGNDNRLDGTIPDHIFKPLANLEVLRLDTFRKSKFGDGFSYLHTLKVFTMNTGDNYCSIRVIANDTFAMFVNNHVEVLDMSKCPIHFIDIAAFVPLAHISELYIPYIDQLPIAIAIKSFYGFNGRNISKVIMKNSYIMSKGHALESEVKNLLITRETMSALSDICIEYLDMSHNKILFVDASFVRVIAKCLKHIDLSYNNIIGNVFALLELIGCRNLLYIDVSHQSIYRPETASKHSQLEAQENGTRFEHVVPRSYVYSNLHTLSYDKGVIMFLPPKLQVLKISYISRHLGKISNVTIIGGSHLISLDFSYNGARGFFTTTGGIQNLQNVDLSGNDGNTMTVNFLKTFPNVKYLQLNYMRLKQSALLKGGPLHEGLIAMGSLERLELSGNAIRYMAADMPPTLRVLDVSQNTLVDIPIDADLLLRLRILDLSFNSITHLEQSDMDKLDGLGAKNNLTLKLDGNPISCSCHELMFVLWLFTSPVSFDKAGRYRCVTDNGTVSTTDIVYDNFNHHWTYCQGRFWLPASTALMFLLLLGIVTTLVVTRNLTRIQHHLLTLMGRGVQRDCRRHFRYDVFVGNCEADRTYALGIVGPCLERFQIRTFLQDRDIPAYRSVVNSVAESVHNSWRTLLVITPDFLLDDPLSYYTMSTMANCVSSSNPDMLIILLVGDVNQAQIPKLLLNVTEEDNIYHFDCFPEASSDIWAELKDRIMLDE